MLQGPLIACETGIPYTFNIVAQSEASGTNFDLNIVLYNEDELLTIPKRHQARHLKVRILGRF